jgi:hypothetical protein
MLSIVLSFGVRTLRCHHAARLVPVPAPQCSRQHKRRDCEKISRSFQHGLMLNHQLVF